MMTSSASASRACTVMARGITQENLHAHELVGLHMHVESAPNAHVVGLNGRVVDETKSMITIRTVHGDAKRIPKQGAALRFSKSLGHGCGMPEAGVIGTVDGSRILQRPFEKKYAPHKGRAGPQEGLKYGRGMQ